MKIVARDFRGLLQIDAEWEGILLLGGRNRSGKTSFCTAVGACASGDLLPFPDVTKAKAALLVRDGAADAAVTIMQTEGAATVHWPSAERRTEGRFLDASPTAVGLESPVEMPLRERAAYLINLLGGMPTKEQFEGALATLGVAQDLVTEAWDSVTKRGWDGAHAEQREAGAKTKGAWERLTGERYGSQKAIAWKPEGWRIALETITLEDLISEAEGRKRAVDKEREKGAVAQAEFDHLNEHAAQVPDLDATLVQIEDSVRRVTAELEATREARARLGDPASQDDVWACPHCGKPVMIVGKQLRAPVQVDRDTRQKLLRSIAEADGNIANRENALRQAEMSRMQTKNRLIDAQKAAAKLAAIPPHATSIAERLAERQRQLDQAAAEVGMVRTLAEATQLRRQIEQRTHLVKTLAEDGLRRSALAARLAEFSAELLGLCQEAGWPAVAIQPDLTVTFDGRPYSLCSASEQYRARITIQIGAAIRRREPLVVIDGAEILDQEGRNDLFGLLAALVIPSVVGMTIFRRDDVPDLERAGIGRSLWIEAGDAQDAQAAA